MVHSCVDFTCTADKSFGWNPMRHSRSRRIIISFFAPGPRQWRDRRLHVYRSSRTAWQYGNKVMDNTFLSSQDASKWAQDRILWLILVVHVDIVDIYCSSAISPFLLLLFLSFLPFLCAFPAPFVTSSPSCLPPRWFHVLGDSGELCPWACSVQQDVCICSVCDISSIFEEINENEDGVIFYSSSEMSALTSCVFETRKKTASRKTFGLAQSHLSSLWIYKNIWFLELGITNIMQFRSSPGNMRVFSR